MVGPKTHLYCDPSVNPQLALLSDRRHRKRDGMGTNLTGGLPRARLGAGVTVAKATTTDR